MTSQANITADSPENTLENVQTKPSKATSAKTKSNEKQPLAVVNTLIIGAGFAGLGSAIRLKQAGLNDIVILERGSQVGGTWRDNTYPGAACDIPSNLYSYSFAQNPNWSRGFSGSPEILEYVHYLVNNFKLNDLIK